MPQDYKDASYSANTGLNGQVVPTVYLTPGVVSTAGVVAAYTTGVGTPGFNTVVDAEQVLNDPGVVYQSPGGVLNKTIGYMTTGGGP
jgi:hypothetical protein